MILQPKDLVPAEGFEPPTFGLQIRWFDFPVRFLAFLLFHKPLKIIMYF